MNARVGLGLVVVALLSSACGPPRPPWQPPMPFASAGGCALGGLTGDLVVTVDLDAQVAAQVGRAATCSGEASLASVADVTLTDDKNELIPAALETRGGSALVVFAPPSAGTYVARVRWHDVERETEIKVLVLQTLSTPFFVTSFVDRMDTCTRGPFRTLSGLTLCQRFDTNVFAYGHDGALVTSFPGAELMVRGDSVWTWSTTNPDLVELRDGTLALVGTAEVGRGGQTTATQTSGLTQTDAGLVFRTATLGAQGLSVVEDPTPWPATDVRGVVSREGDTWWEGVCQVREGCASMPGACEAMRQCPPGTTATPWVVEGDAAWEVHSNRVQPRPFSLAAPSNEQLFTAVSPFSQLASLVQAGGQAPVLRPFTPPRHTPFPGPDQGVFVPSLEAGHLAFSVLATPGVVLTGTREFLVTLPDPNDPFTLRFHRLAR